MCLCLCVCGTVGAKKDASVAARSLRCVSVPFTWPGAVLWHGACLASPGNRCGRGSGVGDGVCCRLTVRQDKWHSCSGGSPQSSLHVKMSSAVALIIIALRSTASHLHDCSADRETSVNQQQRQLQQKSFRQSTCAQTNFSHRVTHAMNLAV